MLCNAISRWGYLLQRPDNIWRRQWVKMEFATLLHITLYAVPTTAMECSVSHRESHAIWIRTNVTTIKTIWYMICVCHRQIHRKIKYITKQFTETIYYHARKRAYCLVDITPPYISFFETHTKTIALGVISRRGRCFCHTFPSVCLVFTTVDA